MKFKVTSALSVSNISPMELATTLVASVKLVAFRGLFFTDYVYLYLYTFAFCFVLLNKIYRKYTSEIISLMIIIYLSIIRFYFILYVKK